MRSLSHAIKPALVLWAACVLSWGCTQAEGINTRPNINTDANSTPDDTNTTSNDSTQTTTDVPINIPDMTLPDTNSGCDINGFSAGGNTANALFPAGGPYPLDEFVIVVHSRPLPPQDRLTYGRLGGPPPVGTLLFTNDNYATCVTNDTAYNGNHCVTIHRECTGELASDCSNEVFITTEGSLEITSSGRVGDTFTAVFRGVKLVEHTINPDDNVATVAPNPEIWCLDGVTINTTIAEGR